MKKLNTSDLSRIALCTALLVLCSWISIPAAVPFTMQTFAVTLLAAVLGGKKGIISVLVYILLGAVGLPVFSGFRSGAAVILSSTGGYIIGFVFIAAIVGFTCDKFGTSLPAIIVSGLLGLIICYGFGTAWYMWIYTKGTKTLAAVLSSCVVPFIIPDIIKIILASLCAKKLKNLNI